MSKAKLFSGAILVFALLVLAPNVLSVGPRTHIHWLNEVCADTGFTSPDKELACVKFKDVTEACMLLVDKDVFHYVTDFKKYAVDHNWNTVQQCFDLAAQDGSEVERACCVGKAAHLGMDGVSHTEMVPNQVKAWGVVSEPIAHVVEESAVDNAYPGTDAEAASYLTDENLKLYCKGKDSLDFRISGVESSWECDRLRDAVAAGGNYQTVFLVGPAINILYSGFIKISGLFPLADWEPYHRQALLVTKRVLNGDLPRDTYPDPTGYEALDLANFGYKLWTSLAIIAIVVVIVVLLVKRLFRRRR